MIDITEKDKDIVLDFIITNYVVEILERDNIAIGQSSIKLKEPYLALIEKTLKRVFSHRKQIRQYMHKHGIKVYDRVDVNEDFVSYEYKVRGYMSQMRFFRQALRNYSNEKIKMYFLNGGESNEKENGNSTG